ncbi:hypothetical protein DB88DRAFT_534894 [Papiliotrema laurentii]|uniref:Magnesium transporter NIPA-domain-containing protein n=1 Tax=Papiliotrema laurentii TaxID=5418 RepID=A0AAD9L691_PAPLA|nr:hypothetical protein DB88DRAFT_534894 [Papiliotrema laurentii]
MDMASVLLNAAVETISVLQEQNGTLTFDNDTFTNSTTDWAGGEILNNGSVVSPIDGAVIDEGSYILNTIIGLIIVLIASLLNALGLNLTKLDHVRQQAIPKRERRREIFRVLWLAGMGTYIASQVFGSPLALRYLRPDWVAPLGSSSLVFNFLFARWLVGTPVTATDINGTLVIVLGVILILVFSSINHGLSQSLDVTTLNGLWGRASWLAYFTFLVLFTSSTYFVSHLLAALLASRASYSPLPSPTLGPTGGKVTNAFGRFAIKWKSMERRILVRLETLFSRTDDPRLIWLQGIGWAVCGGSLAGLCLVFTKVVVKLFGLPGHPLVHPSSILTLLLVILTAVLQIVCLNRALECTDTVVVVPLFYAGYTVFGFINSLIFFDQSKQYARWVLVAVFLSIAVLISGVVLLSLKSSAKTATDPYTVSTEPNTIRLRPQAPRADSSSSASKNNSNKTTLSGTHKAEGSPEADVMWEVGSVSDSGDEATGEERERRGIGGDGRGERRGLLGEEEEDEQPSSRV